MDNDEKIDYSYIWDLVCKSKSEGGILFKDGINLLIFKNPNDDITSKIEIICPTNHYSEEYFNKEKPTLLVYCKGDYFEPLCKIRRMLGHIEITKFFRDAEFKVFKNNTNIMSIIKNIKQSLLQNCMSKKSLKKSIYDYERNILLDELIKELKNIGINEINITQLVNYNNKVIGLEIKNEKGLYIPCLPSSINFKFNFKLVHELKYNTYKFTRDKLSEIYNKSNKKIPCMPKSKLIDDNMVVGIKTITNQIVPVEPVAKTEELDDFEETMTYIGQENSLMNDENMLINREIDDQRMKVVKEIELENNFYKLFRNTFKIIINYKIKIKEKMKLLKLIDDSTVTYIEKLERITEELKELLDEAVEFIEFDIDGLEDYEDLITCLGLNKTDCDKTTHCFMRRGTCKLTLPLKNLYSKNDNNVLYFKKLADEIIRYSKIRKYIFTPKEFLSFEHVNYRINEKEIILLEEILFDNYLEDIKLREDNKYIKSTNIYDITQPTGDIIHYSSSIDLSSLKEKQSKITKDDEKIYCIDKTSKYTKNNANFLKKLVNDDIKIDLAVEQYMATSDCCFKVIQIIIQNWRKEKNIN